MDATEHSVCKVVQQAERLCLDRGVRLTEQRRRVLELICLADKPQGAYDILAAIQRQQPRAAPPTVYRALDFLLEQGFIHKLETLHAFVGCNHPDHPHASQFLICDECGDVTELDDNAIADSLIEAAEASGFKPSRRVVELTGTCAGCRKSEDGS
jgi:Fur family zinc uptake transcriptional regulator